MPEVLELSELYQKWGDSELASDRAEIWAKMLEIRGDQVFSIGTVSGALQPVVRARKLRNLPGKGLYGFQPLSFLGAYLPDTFFYEEA